MPSMHKVVLSRRRLAVITRSKEAAAAAVRRGATSSTTARKKVVVDDEPCDVDVFINHRGADTKRSVAGLLYDRLLQLNVRPFLGNRSMEPGDKLYERIDAGVLQCKVGVAVFSPGYCGSVFCLRELAMMVEAKKKLIPIFCDVKPSQLLLPDADAHSPEDLGRYRNALDEAKHTVGLAFDSNKGNWAELVSRAANIVVKCINEEEAH